MLDDAILTRRRLVVGIGMSSSATAAEVAALVAEVLDRGDADRRDVAAVATRARFAADPRLLALDLAIIGVLDTELPTDPNGRLVVAEPAAVHVAGSGAVVVVGTTRSAYATCALAAGTLLGHTG